MRGANGTIDDETVVRKVLRTHLPQYAIRVSTIQELRCILGNVITLEGLVGRLTTFELNNFINVSTKNVETDFKAKLIISDLKDGKKKKKIYANTDSDIDDEDINELEALLARIFHRGKGKYKVKIPIICFNCHEVGYIAIGCLEKKKSRDEKYEDKYKIRDDKYEDK